MANTENDLGSEHIPLQKDGSEMDAVEKRGFESESGAIYFYKQVKHRLLCVNDWGEVAGIPMSTFTLTDRTGQRVERNATDGDYIKIDIPGPGTTTGDGFDWVVIEEIKEEQLAGAEILTMQVRPAPNPTGSDHHIAHFLKEKATSTFQVKRIGRTVYAEEHGRNEIPNTETAHTLDNIRNTLVGFGAKLGFSYPQWKGLVKGLLK